MGLDASAATRPDRVEVWTVRTHTAPATLARFESVLDEQERARAAGYARRGDFERFVVAHGALRLILGRELGAATDTLRFQRDGGKAELTTASPRSNLSHSGGLCLIALCHGRTVGVDVEQLAEGFDPVRMSERFFPAAEARHVARGGDTGERIDRFTRLWTRKEAAVKACGGRLWPNLRMPVLRRDVVSSLNPAAPLRVAGIDVPPGYRAAVALSGHAPFTVTVHEFTHEQAADAA